jgi:hypothetical protein
MKRILACIALVTAASAGAGPVLHAAQPPVPAHHLPAEPLMGTILPDAAASAGIFDQLNGLAPAYATNCQHYIRPSRTSAFGHCYNYSGSGNYKFQVAALAFDGCRHWVWFYGNVGWPYIRGKTTSGKSSLVYTPPGTWTFMQSTVIVWKP